MTYDIPVWHPFVVHFPIALLLLGGAVAVAYLVTGRGLWRAVTGLVVGTGALGAWVANATGEAMYTHVEGTPIVEELVGRHESLGAWAMWVGAAAFLAWLGVSLWRWRTANDRPARDPIGLRLLVAVPAVTSAILVVLTGRLGGLMVWGIAG